MNIETANRLLQYRKKHNLSQEELAAKIGVSRQAISKWERAEASPDTDNLILLADIYGVTLDELLKGKILTKDESESNQQTDSEQDNTEENKYSYSYGSDGENETVYEKVDEVSFKNGIHINSKRGDHVHINLKDGVHVLDRNGDKVDVGWNGIHVEEGGKQRVYTDEHGNVMVDESMKCCHHKSKSIWNKFPFFIFPIIAFVWWGASGVCFGWALSWICFLTIPLYYTLVDAFYEHKPSHFCYPVLVVIAYILFGYFNVCGGWAFGWIAFLTIPIYYGICDFFKHLKSS
ncbi:MAG: helix-turn-helix transcriptional regulator [Ruminococcus sp.]|nr:helix-turn-helix transcriptional regulator [Ruminococcus sp.]